MTTAKPQIHAFDMVHSLTAPLADPDDLHRPALDACRPRSATWRRRSPAGAKSRYEQAVMLQNWFRVTGGFRYSLKTQAVGSGNPALLHFLFKGPGGRVGYCEQFATAYAVMARTLQIPARVAVGFLQPHQGAKPGEWVYKAHDLHAWPELYFQGSGWVRFEPTPGTRAATTPSYTHEAVRKVVDPKSNQTQGGKLQRPTPRARPPSSRTTRRPSRSTSAGSDIPWTWILLGLGVLVGPRRAGAGPEVRTTLPPDPATGGRGRGRLGRAPRQCGRPRGELARRPLSPRDGSPPRGMVRSRARRAAAGAAPARPRAVARRRGRPRPDRADARAGALRARPATTCPEHWRRTWRPASRRWSTGACARRCAAPTWLPRSLFGGRRRAAARAARDREPEAVAAGGVDRPRGLSRQESVVGRRRRSGRPGGGQWSACERRSLRRSLGSAGSQRPRAQDSLSWRRRHGVPNRSSIEPVGAPGVVGVRRAPPEVPRMAARAIVAETSMITNPRMPTIV